MDEELRALERRWRTSADAPTAEELVRAASRSGESQLVAAVLEALAEAWERRRDADAARVLLESVGERPRLELAPLVDRLACAEHSGAADRFREWFPALAWIVGHGAAIRRVRAQVAAWAAREEPVLLVGEFGVGHQHAATVLHDLSGRPDLSVLYASATADAVFATELAASAREGGTLYLAYADPDWRASLAHELCASHGMRLVVGTVADAAAPGWPPSLSERVIHIPALRERFEDLRPLVESLLRGKRHERHGPVPDAFLAQLRQFAWRGNNLRDLDHALHLLDVNCGDRNLFEPAFVEETLGGWA